MAEANVDQILFFKFGSFFDLKDLALQDYLNCKISPNIRMLENLQTINIDQYKSQPQKTRVLPKLDDKKKQFYFKISHNNNFKKPSQIEMLNDEQDMPSLTEIQLNK